VAYNFVPCDRDQPFLMPPSLLEWVPGDHLVWTILASVEQMDLGPFYGAYRPDGHGRPAYDPQMMVVLLLYAYARGNRSSRGIERECSEDVAYRVICANLVPDHSTIAEFRRRHEAALAELFTSVLALCREAGLVKVGVIAIDGTKIAANASLQANRSYERIVREILEEAAETDRVEDERYGDARGDELPEDLRTPEGRRRALQEAKRTLEDRRGAEVETGAGLELDPERFTTRSYGRRNWLREARHFIDEQRKRQARPIPRSRARRLQEAARRLEQDHAVEREANAQYEAWRARGIAKDGSRRMAPGTTKPYQPPERPAGTINTTDPDSRIVRTRGQPATQGYNCQAAVTEHQIIVAAEVTVDSPDFGHLQPMVEATTAELERVGVTELPEVVVADPGYWHTKQMEAVVGRGIQVLIPPDSGLRKDSRPGWDHGLYAFMRRMLATEHGQAIYRRRMATIEPVFGQVKYNRRFDRFQRRGRAAVRSEWRLAAATHNLLKLHRHRIVAAGA
jgi:transposase